MRAGKIGRWVGRTALAVALGAAASLVGPSAAHAEIVWTSIEAAPTAHGAVYTGSHDALQPQEITWT